MTQSARGLPCDMLFLLKFIKAQICQFSGYVLMSIVLSLGSSDGNLSRKESNSLALHLY